MEENQKQILTLGSAALDVNSVLDHLPGADEKMPTRRIWLEAGGPAATAAATAARLGIKARLAATLGDDLVADMICQLNIRDNVNVELIEQQSGKGSPISITMANHGRFRSIVWTRGELEPYLVTEELKKQDQKSDLLLTDGHEMKAALELASSRFKRGAITMLDAGTMREGVMELIGYCQFVGMSKTFTIQLVGDFNPSLAVEKVRAMGPKYIVVTAGIDGCWGMGPDCILLHQSVFPVDAVDTTGAGDIFHGTWAATFLRGLTWHQQLRFASAAAALGCQQPGGRAGIPDWSQLEAFVNLYPDIFPRKA